MFSGLKRGVVDALLVVGTTLHRCRAPDVALPPEIVQGRIMVLVRARSPCSMNRLSEKGKETLSCSPKSLEEFQLGLSPS